MTLFILFLGGGIMIYKHEIQEKLNWKIYKNTNDSTFILRQMLINCTIHLIFVGYSWS